MEKLSKEIDIKNLNISKVKKKILLNLENGQHKLSAIIRDLERNLIIIKIKNKKIVAVNLIWIEMSEFDLERNKKAFQKEIEVLIKKSSLIK